MGMKPNKSPCQKQHILPLFTTLCPEMKFLKAKVFISFARHTIPLPPRTLSDERVVSRTPLLSLGRLAPMMFHTMMHPCDGLLGAPPTPEIARIPSPN